MMMDHDGNPGDHMLHHHHHHHHHDMVGGLHDPLHHHHHDPTPAGFGEALPHQHAEHLHHTHGMSEEDEEAAKATRQGVNSVNAVSSSPILQYVAQEMRLFHEHLRKACETYEQTGEMPQSLFGVKAIRTLQKASGKKATAGEKRKPTAFNLYIKKRIQEMRKELSADTKYTEIFKKVVEEWGRLTDEEKKAFAAQHMHDDDNDGSGSKKRKADE